MMLFRFRGIFRAHNGSCREMAHLIDLEFRRACRVQPLMSDRSSDARKHVIVENSWHRKIDQFGPITEPVLSRNRLIFTKESSCVFCVPYFEVDTSVSASSKAQHVLRN